MQMPILKNLFPTIAITLTFVSLAPPAGAIQLLCVAKTHFFNGVNHKSNFSFSITFEEADGSLTDLRLGDSVGCDELVGASLEKDTLTFRCETVYPNLGYGKTIQQTTISRITGEFFTTHWSEGGNFEKAGTAGLDKGSNLTGECTVGQRRF